MIKSEEHSLEERVRRGRSRKIKSIDQDTHGEREESCKDHFRDRPQGQPRVEDERAARPPRLALRGCVSAHCSRAAHVSLTSSLYFLSPCRLIHLSEVDIAEEQLRLLTRLSTESNTFQKHFLETLNKPRFCLFFAHIALNLNYLVYISIVWYSAIYKFT